MVVVNLTLRRAGLKKLTDLQHTVILVLACAGRRVRSDELLEVIRGAIPETTPDALRMCANRLEECGVVVKTRVDRHYAVELAHGVQVLPEPGVIRLLMFAVAKQVYQANQQSQSAEQDWFAEFVKSFGSYVKAPGEVPG